MAAPLLAIAFSAALSSGCASVTAEHARRVGSAGEAWGKATDLLLESAEGLSVDADSARALSEAQGLARDGRRAVLEKHAAASEEVADFERLRRHARQLARYFAELGRLAAEDPDRAANDAIVKAAGQASELGKALSGSALLTADERDLLGRVAGLAVRGVRERALARELEARGAAVAHELLVQQTLLEAVRRKVRADAASERELGAQRDVFRPFVDGTVADARDWIALRRGYTLPAVLPEALAAAGDAASRLRTSWAALAEGRTDAAAWAAIRADADALLDLAQAIRKAEGR